MKIFKYVTCALLLSFFSLPALSLVLVEQGYTCVAKGAEYVCWQPGQVNLHKVLIKVPNSMVSEYINGCPQQVAVIHITSYQNGQYELHCGDRSMANNGFHYPAPSGTEIPNISGSGTTESGGAVAKFEAICKEGGAKYNKDANPGSSVGMCDCGPGTTDSNRMYSPGQTPTCSGSPGGGGTTVGGGDTTGGSLTAEANRCAANPSAEGCAAVVEKCKENSEDEACKKLLAAAGSGTDIERVDPAAGAVCYKEGESPNGLPPCVAGTSNQPACKPPGSTDPRYSGLSRECTQQEMAGTPSNENQAVQIAAKPGVPSVSQIETELDACVKQSQRASVCCNDPISCVQGSNSGMNSGDLAAIGAITGGVAQTAVGFQDGIAKQCGLMKNLAHLGTGANVALGAKCFLEKGECEDKCGDIRARYRSYVKQCDDEGAQIAPQVAGVSPQSAAYSLCGGKATYEKMQLAGNVSFGKEEACGYLSANIADMANQAVASQYAAQMAALCEKQASADTASTGFPDIDDLPVFNGDCNDPVNASNPICVNCRGPNAATDPLCQGLNNNRNAGTGAGAGFTGDNAAFGNRVNRDFENLNVTDDVAGQGSNLGTPVDPNDNSARGIPNNGGGFRGGGGAGTFGNFGNNGGRKGGAGYNTDILKGVGGGGGYSVSGAPVAARSGFSGYGKANNNKKDKFKKFDLKKYLPGKGDGKGAKRGLAGMGAPTSEIGRPTDDIFKRITNRVTVLCKFNRLMDCNR